MKILYWVLGVLLATAATYGALNYFASERVEVVTMHTLDADGAAKDTRLWIVDHDGAAFLRTSEGSGWYALLQKQPDFEVTRGEVRGRYTGVAHPELRDVINRAMREKYRWGDAFISLTLGGREDAIALELVPVPDGG